MIEYFTIFFAGVLVGVVCGYLAAKATA